MDAGISPSRQARAQHRHELRTLTYVTLDQANGGVVRNLTKNGIGLQVVAAVRPQQQLRVRFELRYPRVRVEARGEVVWATFSGQCGIRFLDLSPSTMRQIQEWIFGNLLEGISQHTGPTGSIFGEPAHYAADWVSVEEDDGLLLSATPRKVIQLPNRPEPEEALPLASETVNGSVDQSDWLSQPLSGQGLAWTVNVLVVIAGLLLFALVFLSVTREAPHWPMVVIAAGFVAAMYWAFFQIFGGSSLGTRLSRLSGNQEDEPEARFR